MRAQIAGANCSSGPPATLPRRRESPFPPELRWKVGAVGGPKGGGGYLCCAGTRRCPWRSPGCSSPRFLHRNPIPCPSCWVAPGPRCYRRPRGPAVRGRARLPRLPAARYPAPPRFLLVRPPAPPPGSPARPRDRPEGSGSHGAPSSRAAPAACCPRLRTNWRPSC